MVEVLLLCLQMQVLYAQLPHKLCLLNIHCQAGDAAGLIAQALPLCGGGSTASWPTKHAGGVGSR